MHRMFTASAAGGVSRGTLGIPKKENPQRIATAGLGRSARVPEERL
jgi:hypothetical protein